LGGSVGRTGRLRESSKMPSGCERGRRPERGRKNKIRTLGRERGGGERATQKGSARKREKREMTAQERGRREGGRKTKGERVHYCPRCARPLPTVTPPRTLVALYRGHPSCTPSVLRSLCAYDDDLSIDS